MPAAKGVVQEQHGNAEPSRGQTEPGGIMVRVNFLAPVYELRNECSCALDGRLTQWRPDSIPRHRQQYFGDQIGLSQNKQGSSCFDEAGGAKKNRHPANDREFRRLRKTPSGIRSW